MRSAVIVDAVRTPLGKNKGLLSSYRSDELLSIVLDELIERSSVDTGKIEDVVTGCVTAIGEQGANIGRQATLLSSKLPKETPSTTINRLCGSSQQAIHFASQAVLSGDMDYVIACGVESMSRVPMFTDIQGGFSTLNPKLLSKYEIIHQGESAERIAVKYKLSRESLDEYSLSSHKKAGAATKSGYFKSQIKSIAAKDKEGKEITLDFDEGIRPNPDIKKMAELKPVFKADGLITAANSSQISDGASALLIADEKTAIKDGFKPRARIIERVTVAGDPTLQLLEVIPATSKLIKKAKISFNDVHVFEINEAFSCVVLAWIKELNIDPSKVNPNGGAIAHGHPLGATGAVLMTKLLFELERTKGRFGLQVMCIGHGMATATLIERL